ncbi:MAG: MoaD/ThiS family protein [Parvularculaceae bacterium]
MTTRVLFFGALKETAGGAERVVELPRHVTSIDELAEWLAGGNQDVKCALLARSVRIAVDQAIMNGRDGYIGGAKEIAFMTAFSGG